MIQSEFDAFCEMLDHVSEQYNKTLSEGLKILYWQGLVEYDLKAIQQALGKHLKNPDNGMFMPKIADIERMMHGTTQDSALIAWAKVEKAIRHIGTGASVVFDDAIIHKVIHDMGGWLSFGTKTENELPFIAKEFENRYRGYKLRNDKLDYPKVLIGLYEAQNNTRGFKSEPAVLIGDKQKAEQVMIGGNDRVSIGFNQLQIGQNND